MGTTECPIGVCVDDDLNYCEHCCQLGCNGGACEACPCCAAGWCLNGRDGLPTGETQWGERHLDFWRELRAEHGITTPEPVMTPESFTAIFDTLSNLFDEYHQADRAADNAPKTDRERLREVADEAQDRAMAYVAELLPAVETKPETETLLVRARSGEPMSYEDAERTADWIGYEATREHYGSDGWCRCCCNYCSPVGCSHASNARPCPAHPIAGSTS